MQRLSILALILASTACVADTGGEGMQIRQNLAPPADNCTLSPMASSPFFSRGALDLSSPVPYLLTPLIESRISAAMGQESMRTVALRGARIDLELGPVSVEDTAGNVTVLDFTDAEQASLAAAGTTKFRSLFSAPLAPNGGLTSAHFDIVPTTALAALRAKVDTTTSRVHAEVLATVVVYGDLAGDNVDGVPFVYPVTVCNDCVVNVVSTCPAPKGTMVRTGNPCNMFQDGVVDCCSSAGGLVCPSTVETM